MLATIPLPPGASIQDVTPSAAASPGDSGGWFNTVINVGAGFVGGFLGGGFGSLPGAAYAGFASASCFGAGAIPVIIGGSLFAGISGAIHGYSSTDATAAFNSGFRNGVVVGLGVSASVVLPGSGSLLVSTATAALGGAAAETVVQAAEIDLGVRSTFNLNSIVTNGLAAGAGNLAGKALAALGKRFGIIPQCFPAGTPVSTAGGLKPIEQVEAGEEVWAFDLAASQWRLCPVIQRLSAARRDALVAIKVAGETIRSTDGHPFWVCEGQNLADRPIPEHTPDPYEGAKSRAAGSTRVILRWATNSA